VSEKLNLANEEITVLKVQVEEKKKIKYFLNIMVKIKSDECTKLEKVVNLIEDLEKERISEDKFRTKSTKLDQLIAGQSPNKDKGGLRIEIGESSETVQTSKIVDNQKTEDKEKWKINARNFSRRSPIK
jgi:hypothetical protein